MKNKLLTLAEKSGFLLFLFICVCVLAFSTIFISTKNINKYKDDSNEELVILEDPSNLDLDVDVALDIDGIPIDYNMDFRDKNLGMTHSDTNSEEVFKEEEEEKIEEIEEMDEDHDELEIIDDSIGGETKSELGILPVEGNIITEFTNDSLIYCKTLEEWRGHSGIDIGVSSGTTVKAPLDGHIKGVYEDDLWGIVIEIDHGNGLETRLANLGTKEMVKVGLQVRKGDHISTVGKTANIEMLMEDHLHYEVRKNGEIVDPRSINE